MTIYSSIYQGPAAGFSTTSARKKYIAIHNTSNNATADAEASYATRRTDSVSSHYYVDKIKIIQSLDTRLKAWHAGSSQGNTYAIAYEFVGTNDKSRTWWLQNVNWDAAAKIIASDMREWGIANRHITVAQMQAGNVTGIVTHDDMRRAWGGTTHDDPGPNFPMDHLINKISQYLSGGSGGGMEIDMAGEIADAALKQLDGRNALGEVYLRLLSGTSANDPKYAYGINLTAISQKLDELLAKQTADVDEDAIAAKVIAAVAPGIAKAVADELNARLDS
jgi:hypothetical protein